MKQDTVTYVRSVIDAAVFRAEKAADNFASYGELRAAEALSECVRTLGLLKTIVTADGNAASEASKHDLIEHRDALGVSAARWQQDLGRYGAHVTSMLTDEQARELTLEYASEITAREER